MKRPLRVAARQIERSHWHHWSDTEHVPSTSYAWDFSFSLGYQDGSTKTLNFYAGAARVGNVGASALPVPAAAWLFGGGLLGLVGVSRTRRR